MINPSGPMVDLLNRYLPHSAEDATDVARIRELMHTTRDPWMQPSALHTTASAVVVHPGTGRVLLRWHKRQQAWLQIGGHGDPDETEAIEIALREGREETGLADLAPWPDASLIHAVIVPVPARGDEAAHEHADLRFVLATADPDSARPERPDAPLRWFSLPEAQAATTEANVRETLGRVSALLTQV
jgi:8-oxo-dGTP pyrophosphatase MutT (NUDIX family)